MHRFVPIVLLVPALACASAQARAPVAPAALDVPDVPPRLIQPQLPAEPKAVEPVDELPPVIPAAPARQRARDTNRPEPKPEPRGETAQDGTAPQPAAPPVAPLRASGMPEGPEAEGQVKEILQRARKLLDGVDYRSLSPGRKADYDGARNFMKQSDDNLKAANWALARSLAERAETLAKLLGGRYLP